MITSDIYLRCNDADIDESKQPFNEQVRKIAKTLEKSFVNESERCVQCRGEPDGKEYLLEPKGGGAPVLLHEQCWQFYCSDIDTKVTALNRNDAA
jgi:hypothetical protein